jgi:predicted secreted Zn-dependent protease
MQVTLDIRSIRTRTYSVRGATVAEVHRNMPRGCWGRYATNLVDPRWTSRRLVETLTIQAAPVITMPHWPNLRRASEADAALWNTMIAALQRHEEGHHAVFVDYATEFKERLEGYTDPLEADEMQGYWSSFIGDVDHHQARYDTETQHGQRQGVTLEPRGAR